MKPKNTICLWFEKDALEAARFYAATFPDSKVTAVHKAPARSSRHRAFVPARPCGQRESLRAIPGQQPTSTCDEARREREEPGSPDPTSDTCRPARKGSHVISAHQNL